MTTAANVEEVLHQFAQATQESATTPGRVGNVVEITPREADDVLITGDLHGHRANLARIVALADLEANPRRHLVLQEVCHGGPPSEQSGGCMSHQVLEDVARLVVRYPGRVHLLLGNHELAELTNFPIQKHRRSLNVAFRLGLIETYGDAAERVRRAYLPFLRSCPLAARLADGVFISHSLPENVDHEPFDADLFTRALGEDDYVPRSPLFNLVWGRDYRPENARAFADLVRAEVLIHGHEPCVQGFWVPNELQIILDTCTAVPCCVLLPLDRKWTHAEICQRIRRLPQ